ncbi:MULTISPECIES: helix-turn-helix transcriptional regulator [unclassified Crossiella]|uniref:ArsR/SmtB family transcription factor n=1 Tax=unclassified Crossiella TaxID=2620835 RepID=UPI001FFEFCC8|nr:MULTISPECIES: winged helix-turn-helix domain-containing protein [unclassified Crossiella]MCK2239863.1 winged helix-turn-helix domain-containing protein [Crossiella sp. S99.2]MCK2252571.1 winged helix-turn-helix domain-containing protein [Crossiella sp. S99.1]
MTSTELAAFAGLLADPTRAAICLALLDGRAWTAGELAAHARVAASTATEHLNRLLSGGLLTERRQGRHRYVQLADARTAELLEGLVAHLNPAPQRPSGLRASTAAAALARGRTCYDHLAGRLGVAITDAMTTVGLLTQADGLGVTPAGRTWLTGELGADLSCPTGRPLVRACLDWTERRTHLAGAAGAQLCQRFRDHGWLKPVGSGRAVRLTPAGERAVADLLGLDPAQLA